MQGEPCFTRYNFAPKAGLRLGGRLFCSECRLGSNAAHGPLVDERTCTHALRQTPSHAELRRETVTISN